MKLPAFALRFPGAVIAIAVLLAYWPLATFGYSLPHGDTLDCWLPWRYFIAACLQDGQFPLWNPLQQMGYPIHADLQGPAWYVEALALGGTIGHPLWVLQLLYVGYLVLGGMGMRRVVRTVHGHEGAALMMGVAYALGGFFTGHAMHFYAVISAAWLPWALDAQLRLLRMPHWRPALSAAVFQSFLLTGGNHTFTILEAYLVAALFAQQAWSTWRSDKPALSRLVRFELLFVAATMLMACGTLWSAVEVLPWMTRGEGLDLATAAGGAFTGRALISILLPFASGVDKAWLGTDPTMANGYMGVLAMVFAGLAFFRPRRPVEIVMLVFGLVCGLASFGSALPVHRALHAVVPGLDLFRFPSYFLWGAQFAALVLAGGTLANWSAVLARRRIALVGLAATTAVVIGLMVVAWTRTNSGFIEGVLFAQLRALTISQRILLNGAVLLVVLVGAVFLTVRRRAGLRGWALLLVLEMVWGTGLATWNTAVADLSPFAVQARIDAFPSGPVVPPLTPLSEAKDDALGLQVLWRNTQNYKGRPSHGGFNSFQLKHTAELQDGHPELEQALLERPLLFLTTPGDDKLRSRPMGEVVLHDFSYSHLEAQVAAEAPTFLVVQQAWYPGWTAQVDGVEVPVERVHVAAFGLPLAAGKHAVTMRFHKHWVPWLLALSLASLFTVLFALARTGPARGPRTTLVMALLAAILYGLFGHAPKSRGVEAGLYHITSDGPMPGVISTDRPALAQSTVPHATLVRCERTRDLPLLVRAMEERRSRSVLVACAGIPLPPEALPLLNDLGWHLVERDHVAGVDLFSFVRQEPGTEGHGLYHDALDGGKVLASPASPYSAAFRMKVGDLAFAQGDRLAVDLRFKAAPGVKAFVVIERKRDDKVTDHEAVPLVAISGTGEDWNAFMVLRDRRELRDPLEDLGVYVWNDSRDSLWVKDLRVRMIGGLRAKDGG